MLHSHSRAQRAVALAVTGLLSAGAAPALAATPAPPRNITVFPDSDMVVIEGYDQPTAGDPRSHASAEVDVVALRNGVEIGRATAALGPDGGLEVNHPADAGPTVCWDGHTPDLLPGDEIRLDVEGWPAAVPSDSVTVADVSAGPAQVVDADGDGSADDVVVRGRAADADGQPVPLDRMEQRITAKLADNRKLRAPGTGTIAYDPPAANPDGTAWTATYLSLSAADRSAALAAGVEVRAWEVSVADAQQGLTIAEVGAAGGPSEGCDAPAARYAVTQATPSALNIAAAGQPLVLAGTAPNATGVSVRLDDTDPATEAVTVTGELTGRGVQTTWQAEVPAALHGALADGRLTASATYTVADPGDPTVSAELGGTPLTLVKDLVAPAAPTVFPLPGAADPGTDLTLTAGDADGVAIRYAVGPVPAEPAEPAATTAAYSAPVRITSDTRFTARAYDAAGNPSQPLVGDYTMRTVPGAPTAVTATPGVQSATVRWSAPASDGGTAVSGYVVRAVGAPAGQEQRVDGLAQQVVVPDLVAGRKYTFEVFALNRLGTSAAATSATVVPSFRDVAGTTHEQSIAIVAELGVTTGYPDGTFRPAGTVTRGQLASFIDRAFQLPAAGPAPAFSDTAGTVHRDAIARLAAAGVVGGFSDGTFRPEVAVTREQMASILDRALRLPAAPSGSFPDTVGSVHAGAIDRLAAAGIAGGFADGTFRPGDLVSRGQMATFLVRSLALRG